jgi:cysteine desulfurase
MRCPGDARGERRALLTAHAGRLRSNLSHVPPIYLDHNATTPVLPEVVDAMLPYLGEHFGNPSSGHVYGQRAKAGVERARGQVAALVGAAPDEIVFTSGGTEASNLAIRGAAAARPERRALVTSGIEHPASAEPCRALEAQGWKLTRISVGADGRARVDEARAALGGHVALVTLIHAHNETGVLQPIAEVARAARAVGALVHADAAQSAGKVAFDVNALGVDLLSIAGHKLYAPKGVGALYVRRGTPLRPLLVGAGHERGVRPGTENVASIVGLGAACEIARATLEREAARQTALRERLLARLRAAIPDLVLHGHPTERLPNTLFVSVPGLRGSEWLARAPDVAASTGSACHEGDESPPAVLIAMGVPAPLALGAIRLSLGRGTTEADVERAAEALVRARRS